jgi:hypothetical protein
LDQVLALYLSLSEIQSTRKVVPIIAEGPITKHLEKGRMTIIANLIDILRPKALLGICQTFSGGMWLPEKVWYQRLHAASCKKRRRIIFRHKRRGGNNRVVAVSKKTEKSLANLGGLHNLKIKLKSVGLQFSPPVDPAGFAPAFPVWQKQGPTRMNDGPMIHGRHEYNKGPIKSA